MRTTSNPGNSWECWTTKIKKHLQGIEEKNAQDIQREVESRKRVLKAAAVRYRTQDSNQSRHFYESSLEYIRSMVENNAKYNHDESFDHHVKHMNNFSKNFVLPPDSSCRVLI